MSQLHLLYHTVKYLKPIQLFNRFRRKIFKSKIVHFKDVVVRKCLNDWVSIELIKSSYVSKDIFCFLNHEGTISNWCDPEQEKLWVYNLHYFDDLNAFGSKKRADSHRYLINKWIDENPPLIGAGWEPYPQSLRIVNWIKWFLSGNSPESSWNHSLCQQTGILEQELEYHLLGNHLFANAKALVFAGCYFQGTDAERWLIKGLSILDKELPEQILADGGNFELSPMYHNILLADMLDLINLAKTYCIPELNQRLSLWESITKSMLFWMRTMTHADGEVPFFNDSAIGISARPEKLIHYADKLNLLPRNNIQFDNNQKISYLKDSGYIKLSYEEQAAFLDVANVGPDYIPGHAHADTLSFEWSYGKQRVFVNSGTSVYGLSEERLRQRKTKSHNTVEVDGLDSSEVWSGFRVAKRAYPSIPFISETENSISINCSHDGYERLQGKVTHTRNWDMKSNEFKIEDTLTGYFVNAKAHYHIHPDITIHKVDSDFHLVLPTGCKFRLTSTNGHLTLHDSTWHPEFGLTMPNKKLVLTFIKPIAALIVTKLE